MFTYNQGFTNLMHFLMLIFLLQTSTPLKSEESITEQLKNYIDEVDEVLYKETGIRITTPTPTKQSPQPIIIDVDKAENISSNKKHKLNFGLGKKLKSLTQKRQKTEVNNRKNGVVSDKSVVPDVVASEETPDIEFEEEIQLSNQSPVMIHSSQQPAEKPPLTKGMLFH